MHRKKRRRVAQRNIKSSIKEAVSYTHLDVYKRQVHKRIAKIAGAYEDYVTAEYQKYWDK